MNTAADSQDSLSDAELVDLLQEQLKAIENWLPRLLAVDRNDLLEKISESVMASFAAQPTPDEREGIETGLDFLGLLKTEGSDHGLYESTMELFDGEIYDAVANLEEPEQIALLMPLSNMDDLVTEEPPEEWAELLRSYGNWEPKLRSRVLSQIPEKFRHG